jgi:hypothetical protein
MDKGSDALFPVPAIRIEPLRRKNYDGDGVG